MKSITTDINNLPPAIVEELQEILADMNRFLFDWSARVAQTAATTDSAAEPDAVLKQQIALFQADQQAWESQKRIEQQQWEATANHLTAAWIRLEQEQRIRSQAGTAMPTMVPAQKMMEDVGESIDATIDPVQGDIEPFPSRAVGAERVNRPPDLIPREAAVRQFEKLKHAISSCSSSST